MPGYGGRSEGGEGRDDMVGTCGSNGDGSNGSDRPEMTILGNGSWREAPEDTRENVRAHGFCKRGTTTLFGVKIVNLNAGSYLRMSPENSPTIYYTYLWAKIPCSTL